MTIDDLDDLKSAEEQNIGLDDPFSFKGVLIIQSV